MVDVTRAARTWWTHQGLDVADGRLRIAGREAEDIARTNGTPLYVHDLVRVEEQATALRDALADAGLRGIVRLALKAQREPAVLRFLRERCPWVGIDACSPGEVDHALSSGWPAAEISYTGTNLSDRDIDRIVDTGVHVNADLLSQLDRLGRRAPGSSVGIRVDPGVGASHAGGRATLYTGRPTKFGIFAEQLDEAIAIASRHRLALDTVHVHVGDGYLTEQLPVFEETVRRLAEMVRHLRDGGCPITEVNTGGGLGVPVREGDEPLDLDRWASILARHLGPLDVVVGTEPGDFLVKESVAMLAEVVTVEDRGGSTFVGVDAGWPQLCGPFIYDDELPIVLCRAADAEPVSRVTVSGNINEGDDLFAEDRPMPEIHEGDVLAILGVGSYAGSMWSEHCLRPPAGTVFFIDRSER